MQWRGEYNCFICSYVVYFKISRFLLPAGFPAVRSDCARCMPPEILHNSDNRHRFSKLLFRLSFVHCAIVVLFILHYSYLFLYIPLNKVRILLKKVLISSWFLPQLTQNTGCTCDIAAAVNIVIRQDICACMSLLHRELQNVWLYPRTCK